MFDSVDDGQRPVRRRWAINYLTNVDERGDITPPTTLDRSIRRATHCGISDGSFKPVPLKASLLSAKVVPQKGGETEYASLRAAYADLPEDRKSELEGLVAEHSMAYSREQIAPGIMTKAWLKDTPPVEQDLVHTVPETGKKALYVGSYASRIMGWPIEKGRALLKELLEWVDSATVRLSAHLAKQRSRHRRAHSLRR